VNAAAGLPGAGRLELDGDAFDNGTAGACPTLSYLLPTSKGGVLDTGWTGIAHDATVPGQGKVELDRRLEAAADVKPGRVLGPFRTASAAMRALKQPARHARRPR
jgi:hypothetical protein